MALALLAFGWPETTLKIERKGECMTLNSIFWKILLVGLVFSCASKPETPTNTGSDPLDAAIRETSDYLNDRINRGVKVVFLNFQSDYPSLSEYIIDGLIENTVNDGVFTAVDRQNITLIRQEMNFQFSGEVSDESAQAIGKILGAQIIVSGSISPLGNFYRLRVRAISVETAEIQGQINRDIVTSPRLKALLANRGSALAQTNNPAVSATTPGGTSSGTATVPPVSSPVTQSNNPVENTTVPGQTAPIPAQTPAPRSQISSDRPGLYVNGAYQGQMDLMDSVDWIALNARVGGNYVIVLGRDEAASNISLSYNNQQVSVTLKASVSERKVSYDTNRPSYSLITVGQGVTFVLEEGVALTGLQNDSQPMVRVAGGTLTMNGGRVSDNNTNNQYWGGVYIESGTFIMNNGTISGNSSSGAGGGVYIAKGTFTMNNGTISRNSCSGAGGGVYIASGTFTMNGGIISGNSAEFGGGVFVDPRATFTKSGSAGIIYGSNAPDDQANKTRSGVSSAVYTNNGRRNTTARVSTALDSRKNGAAGGWE
jgi:TolB-like protein